MLKRAELNEMWSRATHVCKEYPSTYCRLLGYERLAVLRLLREPVQSTLHQVLQQRVLPGTKCLDQRCSGTLDQRGHCSQDCEQLGINVVDDVINCVNCDCYGFPCPNCHVKVFRKQLKMCLEDY